MQHRRVVRRGHEHVAEAPQRVGAQHAANAIDGDPETITEEEQAILDKLYERLEPYSEEIGALLPEEDVIANLRVSDVSVVGTTSDYPEVMEHRVADGRFMTPVDSASAEAVQADGNRETFLGGKLTEARGEL